MQLTTTGTAKNKAFSLCCASPGQWLVVFRYKFLVFRRRSAEVS
jgi:hypothetical protein